MTRRRALAGAGFVLLGAALIQWSAALVKPVFAVVGPSAASAWRFLLGAVVLVILTRPRLRHWNRTQWLGVAALGASTAFMNLCFYQALARIPLGGAVAIEYLGPFMVAALGKRSWRHLALVGLAGLGVLALARPGGGLTLIGTLFAVGSGVGWAAYAFASHRVGGVTTGFQGLAMSMSIATLLTLPFSIGSAHVILSHPLPARAHHDRRDDGDGARLRRRAPGAAPAAPLHRQRARSRSTRRWPSRSGGCSWARRSPSGTWWGWSASSSRASASPTTRPRGSRPSFSRLARVTAPRSFVIRTFGCQMNEHDSERLAGRLVAEGYVAANDEHDADVVILNTCTIRENADLKLYSALGHLKGEKQRRPGHADRGGRVHGPERARRDLEPRGVGRRRGGHPQPGRTPRRCSRAPSTRAPSSRCSTRRTRRRLATWRPRSTPCATRSGRVDDDPDRV